MALVYDQLAMMNLHYQHHTLPYFLDAAVKNEVENIELWAATPHLYIEDATAEKLKQVKKAISDRGLKLICFTPESVVYPFNIAESDTAIRERSLAYILRGVECAAELGSPKMLLTPGWGNLDEDRDEAMKRSLAGIATIVRRAEELGVQLALEHLSPISSNLINTSAQLRWALDEINSPTLKGMIDFCQVFLAGETVQDYFDVLGEDLIHIHIVDGVPGGHLAIGDGNLPMEESVRTVAKNNYTGYLSLEISDRRYFMDPIAADKRSIEQFKSWI